MICLYVTSFVKVVVLCMAHPTPLHCLISKTILFVSGYSFCKGFVKPYVTYENIKQYSGYFSNEVKIIDGEINEDN